MAIRAIGVVVISAALSSGCGALNREKRIREPIRAEYAVTSPEFRRTAEQLLGAPLVEGNAVVELINGDRIFPAMLEAIRSAETSVTLEMFIFSSGKIGDRFVEALAERASKGVRVHVMVDAVGAAGLKKRDVERMKEAGVNFEKFHSLASTRIFRANQRTHRKLMVVDGRVGFIGGVCISDDWQGDAQKPYWRDTHFKVTGPVVAQLQAAFAENWLQMKSEVLHGNAYFPPLEKTGGMAAQAVRSGYKDAAELTRLSYLLSIAAAKKNIRIAHSYFAPDTLMIETLLAALERGVKIEIMVPQKSDNPLIGKAQRPRWRKLLDAGAQFYEYEKTLFHLKVMVVDEAWSIVGSVNFDERSFKLNDEANLNVLNAGLAARIVETFEADKKDCKRLGPLDLKRQNWFSRVTDDFFGLFRGQL